MSNEDFVIGPDNEPDKYRLLTQVGSGGEAQLWKAELLVAGQSEPVAVKMLRADRLNTIGDWKLRWSEQAELLQFIRHPGVVGVREHFQGWFMHLRGEAPTASGQRSLYLVMNWVEGPSLREWVPLHRSAEDHFDGLRFLAQLGDVLDWLHSGQAAPSGRPIVHADVTPSNVIITDVGQAVLVDFGLLRVAGGATGSVEGTRGYMAPEVLASGSYSPASDRYAFGALTFFVLTGEHPPGELAQIRARLTDEATIAAQPGLLAHVMTMFAPDPDARPPAGEWIRQFRLSSSTATAITGMRTPPPRTGPPAGVETEPTGPQKRRRGPLLIAAVVAALLALIVGGIVVAGGGSKSKDAAPRPIGSTAVPAPIPSTEDTSTTTTLSSDITASTSLVQNPNLKAEYLDELKYVDGSADTGEAKANAVQYLHALVQYASSSDRQYVEYDISRSWVTFQATVALRDDAPADSNVFYAVYLDGVKMTSGQLRLGTSAPVKVDVTKGLRLRLEVTNPQTKCCESTPYVVWGDPQLTR